MKVFALILLFLCGCSASPPQKEEKYNLMRELQRSRAKWLLELGDRIRQYEEQNPAMEATDIPIRIY